MLRISKRCVALLCTCLMAVALCGCAADDNKNNDVSNALAEALLEAAQQQNQQAQQNTEETDLQPQDAVSAQEAPVLMTDLSFPGIATSDTWHNDDGSYVESFQYDGAAMLIQFCRFPGDCDKAGAINAVAEFTGVSKESIEAEKTPFGPYEAYRLFYTWGSFEDASFCRDMMIIAEGQMYLFHTRTAADYFDQHSDEIDEWMDGLILDSHPRTPPYMTGASAADALYDPTGWWVNIDEAGADPKFPIINYFDGDGNAFLSYEDCYAFDRGEETHCCKWEIANGEAIYWDIGAPDEAPVKCSLTFDGDERMHITWPDGVTSSFAKNTSKKGSHILRKTEYYFLAQAPILCYVKYDKPLDEDWHDLLIDDVVWVDWNDADLIAEYHLENANFCNDYELVNEDPTYTVVTTQGDLGTTFSVVHFEDGHLLGNIAVSTDEFMEILKGYSEPMLAEVKVEEYGFISMIREVYVP